jgi:hypothetical protein
MAIFTRAGVVVKKTVDTVRTVKQKFIRQHAKRGVIHHAPAKKNPQVKTAFGNHMI